MKVYKKNLYAAIILRSLEPYNNIIKNIGINKASNSI